MTNQNQNPIGKKLNRFQMTNSMEPLVTNRQCLVWLRIGSPDESITQRQKQMHTTFATIVLAALFCVIVGCLAFFWKFISIDVGRSVFALLAAIVGFSALYMATVGMIWLREKICAIFDDLSAIHRDSKIYLSVQRKVI